MDKEVTIPPCAEDNSAENPPSISFRSITFSDGTTVELDATDVVVLVGPNNAGKSLALQELDDFVGGQSVTLVFRKIEPHSVGTSEDFDKFVRQHAQIRNQGNSWSISAYGLSVGLGGSNLNLKQYWPSDLNMFRSLFCLRVSTETRITDSNPANSIDTLQEPSSHPIHMLLDDRIETKLSEYFRRAFDEDLILYRGGGSKLPLLVGERLVPEAGEDRISAAYLKRLLSSTVPLQQQGDGMRSFASVILHLLAPLSPSILLLDEPEAFLHPPQARLLGEIIAAEGSSRAQLFVATHSPDVLHGLINVASNRLRVLRIQRDGKVNRAKELDKSLVQEISVDPLMKYSSVMSGVFHERVVICESDADCMFYSSILDLPDVHGQLHPDVLFVHASGKDRLAALARTLTALDVPVDVIADIDILNDVNVFGRLVDALGKNPARILPLVEAVKKAIEQRKPWLTINEIKKGIEEELAKELPTEESVSQLRSRIDAVSRKALPWDAVKAAGASAIPSGQPTQQFNDLVKLCKQIGLWIVPVGELEGFCRSVGGHGPRWVQRVVEDNAFATNPELEHARDFIREIWQSK